MTLRIVALVAALVALAAAAAAAETTRRSSAARGASRKVSLTHALNATGHWTASLRLEASSTPDAAAQPMAVDLASSVRLSGRQRTDTVVLTLTGSPPQAPPGYISSPGAGYYKAHDSKKLWSEAKTVCESENAYLVILNSEAEAAAVRDLINSQSTTLSEYLHAGFYRRDEKWFTIFDEPLESSGYTSWEKDEPNNSGGKEDRGSIVHSALYNDVPADFPAAFLCELA